MASSRSIFFNLFIGALITLLLIFFTLKSTGWHSSRSFPLPSSSWDLDIPTDRDDTIGDAGSHHPKAPNPVDFNEVVSPASTGSRHRSRLIKPEGVKIYALVPFGRPSHIEILDCYLQKNLARNGGVLDEVHFALNTNNQEHKDWMKTFADQVPGYKTIDLDDSFGIFDFWSLYRQTLQRGNVYVKIDDDTAWLDDGAIDEMVYQLLTHPEAFLVASNLVTATCELGWMHLRSGALHTYLPEQIRSDNASEDSRGPKAWRASALPTYEGPLDVESTPFPDASGTRANDEQINAYFDPPFTNHRWLPLRDNDTNLPLTPLWYQGYCGSNQLAYHHWEIAAQGHYSLLENIERDQLHLYDFGGRTGLWNMRYEHTNINVIAAWADDILDAGEMDNPHNYNDEWFLSMQAPRPSKRQVYVATHALAAHFSFSPQSDGMYQTDLLHRWRAYTNEKICPADKQIPVKQGEWFAEVTAPYESERATSDLADSGQDLRSLATESQTPNS